MPGVEGRLLSSSYAPGPGHPQHAPMLSELRRHLRCQCRSRVVPFSNTRRDFISGGWGASRIAITNLFLLKFLSFLGEQWLTKNLFT